jgi:Phosphatidylinositol transfer protein
MVAKSSQEETGKEAGEGVEIVKNIPYSVDDPVNRHSMEKGQYT